VNQPTSDVALTTGSGQRAWTTAISTSAAELATEGWDDLVMGHGNHLPPHHLYTASPWLRRYETFGDWDQCYVAARRGGMVAGGLTTHRVDPATATAKLRVHDLFPELAIRHDDPLSMVPSRVVGGLMDGRTGILSRPGQSLVERRALIDRLLHEAECIAMDRGERAVICRCIDGADTLVRSVLRRRGYAEHPGPQHLVLTRPPGGLDGYIGSFSKRYREMIRREMRKLADAQVQITVEALTRELITSVLPLVSQLHAKHEVDVHGDEARNEFEVLRRIFKHDAMAVVARVGDRPVGFVELVLYRGNAWAHQAGFDYEFQGTLPVYFGVLFYGLMDFAEAAGIYRIDYSFGTEHAKVSRGCASRPTVRAIRMMPPAA